MTAISDIRSMLQRRANLNPALLDGPTFDRLIDRQASRCGVTRSNYLQLLHTDPEELEHLVADIAVQESWLFRYPASFELLVAHLQHLLRTSPPDADLHMLSVGCAAGQEPVSMAIAALHAGWSAARVMIEAIDCNRRALTDARRGIYPQRALRQDRPRWVDRWIARQGDDLAVDPAILSMVRYRHDDAVVGRAALDRQSWEIIFCRNLLIYLNEQARRQLVSCLASGARQGGLLFVGHAEQPGPGGFFEALKVPQAFAWRRVEAPSGGGPAVVRHPNGGSTSRAVRRLSAVPPAIRMVRPRDERQRPSPPSLAQARALADRGDLQAARDVARAALAAEGPSAEGMELLGSIHLALGQLQEARRFYRQALYCDPQNAAARLQLRLISIDLDD